MVTEQAETLGPEEGGGPPNSLMPWTLVVEDEDWWADLEHGAPLPRVGDLVEYIGEDGTSASSASSASSTRSRARRRTALTSATSGRCRTRPSTCRPMALPGHCGPDCHA